MTPLRFLRPLLGPALAAALLAGCDSLPRSDGARTGPFYSPANVQGVPRLPDTVRRIVLLPSAPADPKVGEDTLRDLDRILATALTRSARGEIVTLDRDRFARLAGHPGLLSTALLPAGFPDRLAADSGADAMLMVDVTSYSPYPPLVIGLRARLVGLKAGDPLWNFDNIISTADPLVVNGARAHALRRTPATGTPGELSYTVLQNPLAFADYVADTVWLTLPPR